MVRSSVKFSMTGPPLTEDDIEPQTLSKTKKFLSKISLKNLRSQPWAGAASDVLSLTGNIAEVAGAAGLPFAGLVGLALKLGAGVLKTDDATKIKDIVTQHYGQIKATVAEVEGAMLLLREDVLSVLMLLLDTHYRNGILSIEAAFETFLDVDGSTRALTEKLEEFRSHKFEVEKDYRHHLSPGQVEEYLAVVYKHQGVQACISLWDFISLVQVRSDLTQDASLASPFLGEISPHVGPLLFLQ